MCRVLRAKERVKVVPMVGSNIIGVVAEGLRTEQLSGETASASPLEEGLR